MEESIFIELHDVDVAAIQQDQQGQVTGIRVALPLAKAKRLLNALARELRVTVDFGNGTDTNAFSFQKEWLSAAMCPDRNWN